MSSNVLKLLQNRNITSLSAAFSLTHLTESQVKKISLVDVRVCVQLTGLTTIL